MQEVQRRIEAQFAAEGIEIDAEPSKEAEAVIQARQAAEAAARAEEQRIAQLGKELAAIEQAELDFEKESDEKAAARHVTVHALTDDRSCIRARRRTEHDQEMKRMMAVELEAKRAAAEQLRHAAEEQRRRLAEEERLRRLEQVPPAVASHSTR